MFEIFTHDATDFKKKKKMVSDKDLEKEGKFGFFDTKRPSK